MLKGVIFDMDGLLIDSEPLWRETEIIVFGRVGIQMTEEVCKETLGLRIDEVVEYRYREKPWNNKSLKEVEEEIYKEFIQKVKEKGKLMEGAKAILHFFKEREFKIGLASSSPYKLLEIMLEATGIRHYFETVCSAENEEYGKPHPAVYITAAKNLGLAPWECITFEDSFNGLLSAKSARTKAVSIPEKELFTQSIFDIADLKLQSLTAFNELHLNQLNQLLK